MAPLLIYPAEDVPLDLELGSAKVYQQAVLIDLFQVAMFVIPMNRKPCLPDQVAQLHNVLHAF